MGIGGKHGTFDRRARGGRMDDGEPLVIRVIDNTDDGLSDDEIDQIATVAATQGVYFNDLEARHWMFDFRVCGHWCEGVFPEVEGSQVINPLHVNVYE